MDEDGGGRELKIVIRRGVGGPAVVAVTLVASACGSNVSVGTTGTGGMGGVGGAPTTSAGGMGGTPFVGGSGPGVGAGGEGPCGPGELEETFTVEVPPEGTPAEAGQICGVTMGAVESNTAARVTLTKDPQALEMATGEVTIEPSLLADVVGLPSIEVLSSPLAELEQMSVTNVTPTATGFSFDASWPPPLTIEPSYESVMIIRTRFDLACPPNPPSTTKQVEAITHVNLCGDDSDDLAWVSSGDECTICGIIAEMAPSPIVPDVGADDIGLGRVIQLRLVVVARVGRSLLVLAEHDGGEGLDYEWVPTDGELVPVASDLVLWTPPEGADAVLQVAVQNDDAAAVASLTDVPVRAAGMVA